jgi:hypothetical protein
VVADASREAAVGGDDRDGLVTHGDDRVDDRVVALAARVRDHGATVVGPNWLLGRLDAPDS